MPVISQLQLSNKKKTGILAIFMVGLFALVASIVSLVYRVRLWQGIDPTWNGSIVMICAIIEMGVTIVCSSTPALVMFWKSHIVNYVVPLYSRLGDGYSKLTTRFKLVSRASSNTQTCLAESDQSKSHPSFDNLDYMGLNEHLKAATFLRGSVRTDIAGGSPISEVENGVIRKVMKVEQSFN
ncbi:hypothetical protein MMC22_005508 [Lobaria immixta]|nr:hypothetical protein [Lobaria immixta]